jgi:filamentous hemagglutinin
MANESKVGYTTLTKGIQTQIAKDVELKATDAVKDVTWHFFKSPVTGMGGPSQQLLNSLQQNGINVVIH